MKKKILWVLILASVSATAAAQSDVEQTVLQRVQQVMRESGGRVTFSQLHNDTSFSPAQRDFLSRLYEIFFQIPGFLERHYEDQGKVPTRSQIGAGFNLSVGSVELLLRVMETDSRVPTLFTRDGSTREITELKIDNIKAFIQARGEEVRITQWEGRKIPSFQLPKIGGGTLSSEEISGQGALLYFWFTGCPPCVRIAPILAELDREYRSRGFRIVGLNADKVLEIETTEEQRIAYLEKHETKYDNVHLDEATRQAFGNINVYPTLFFIDGEGRVVKHLLNYQDRATLEALIQQISR